MKQIRLEGYGTASIFGPIGLAIAAGVLEGKMVPELRARLRKVEEFYDNLDKTVNTAFSNIDEAKGELKNEIQTIGELKVRTEETNTYVSIDETPELRDIAIQSAKDLIATCNECIYRYQAIVAKYTETSHSNAETVME